MIFQNEIVSLHVEALKYEFNNAFDTFDRNWLIIKVKLSEGNKVFETMDPFLQTSELQHMKEWFQTSPNPTYTRIDFIEPNLSFEFIGEKEEIFQIIVRLSIELNPSWCKEEEYEFCITITQEDRKNIIRLIEEQQIKFPKR